MEEWYHHKVGWQNAISELTVAAGVVNARTNDVQFKNDYVVMNSHGAVAGNKVRSPRFFLGLYNDWRNGFEDLGEATATLCPKLEWNGGTIFAWQSWGGMADKVNYAGAVDVADFFKEQMMPKGFVNENGVCYIVLDSFGTTSAISNYASLHNIVKPTDRNLVSTTLHSLAGLVQKTT